MKQKCMNDMKLLPSAEIIQPGEGERGKIYQSYRIRYQKINRVPTIYKLYKGICWYESLYISPYGFL